MFTNLSDFFWGFGWVLFISSVTQFCMASSGFSHRLQVNLPERNRNCYSHKRFPQQARRQERKVWISSPPPLFSYGSSSGCRWLIHPFMSDRSEWTSFLPKWQDASPWVSQVFWAQLRMEFFPVVLHRWRCLRFCSVPYIWSEGLETNVSTHTLLNVRQISPRFAERNTI